MKKVFISLAFVLFGSSVAAPNVTQFSESAKALTAAIAASTDVSFREWVYLPGYGFDARGSGSVSDIDKIKAITNNIKSLTAALSNTVKGADATDWISFSVTGYDNDQLLVREKFSDFGKTDKWEVWINNDLQK